MEFFLAFAAGLLTLLNPCVLPVLPLAMASGMEANRAGPIALAAGMGVSFTIVGTAVSALGPALGLSPEIVARIFAFVMVAFGLVLLTPALNARFSIATAGLANSAAQRLPHSDSRSLGRQFAGGALLGAVWVPCIGPTLGGAIALASQGAELGRAAAIMAAFSLGVGIVAVAIGYGVRRLAPQTIAGLSRWAKPVTGIAFVLVGLATFFGLTDLAAGSLLDVMPVWLQDLSVSI